MTREDFEFAVSLTDTMNWDMAEEDFEFAVKLEPQGCFVLFDSLERIGMITTISFEKVGFFGNLIVSEKHRGKGAGASLVRYAINYLRGEKVKTVAWYSYMNAVPFYHKLGFEEDLELIVLKGNGHFSRRLSGITQVVKSDVQKILQFDSQCLSYSRAKLLKPLLLNPNNLAFVAVEDESLIGYAIAKVYDDTAQVGPVVSAEGQAEIATDLVKAIMDKLKGSEISMCIPGKKEKFLDMLIQIGFHEDFRVARMFSGEPLGNICVFAAESLERG
jgi:GNAT superfamily N-acetyltransferase/type III secretion system FlhB-like substrate exporter